MASLKVGISSDESTAIVQADSTEKGALVPRMTTTQRDAIASPATGLLVWNTTTEQLEEYNGASWQAAGGGGVAAATIGGLSDVTITGTPADNEVLAYDDGTSEWINQTAAEAGLAAASHSHAASDVTSGELVHERGGLEADVSAYDGYIRITGGATSNIKSEFAAAAAPDADDDVDGGWVVGSRWIDTTNDKEYVCLDNTDGAAVWTETTGAGGGGGGDAADITYTPTVDADWDSDTDPGNVDDALDQLAERVDDLEGATGSVSGEIMLSAAGGWPSTTGGCAANTQNEYGTNDVDLYSLDFDPDTDEYAQWSLVMPDDWDASTITAKFYWSAASSSGDVVWALQGRAYANDDAIDAAWGTAQTATDTLTATGDMCITAATSAITLAGTPAAGQFVQLRVYRDADAGGDTLDADARLLAVMVTYGKA